MPHRSRTMRSMCWLEASKAWRNRWQNRKRDQSRYTTSCVAKEFNEESSAGWRRAPRLDALISQINPHFLFNALNTVGVLIDENPERSARGLTVKLA